MRYISKIFQPLITIPKNAKIKNTEITCKSQKLLLECGLVRPTSSGLFTLLPLARRALDKLEALVIQAIESAGGQRMSLPALTSSQLWDRSGRLDDVGTELMRVEDRHGKKYLLAPTHEEAIADLLADVGSLSYKQLPLLLYQISNKYRDEHRPKHGLLRARSFAMMDAYGAHASAEAARGLYAAVAEAYQTLFDKLQLPVYRVSAPSGDMGGSLSHEWQLCAAAGEDALDICPSCSHAALARPSCSHEAVARPSCSHAALAGRGRCAGCGGDTDRLSSIEVGHTFILGTRYSEPLKAHYIPAAGPSQPLIMSCYGIGITRLLAASVEALSTEESMRWPKAIAPYNTIIIGPKEGSKEWQRHGEDRIHEVYNRISEMFPDDVLMDDRHNLTVGKRLMMADKMGYPNIIVCGRAVLEDIPRYEVHRSTPQRQHPELVTLEELQGIFSGDVEECRPLGVNKV